MADFILLDGDIANFMPAFGIAVVAPQPGTLSGSGPAIVDGKKLCLDGDESSGSVPGCTYVTPVYVTPGTGTIKISALAANQKAKKTNSGGKAVMLKGATFTARFEVQSPAQQPTPGGPVPDSTPKYTGQGSFTTTNTKVMAE